ncbi:hypothetical protein AMATHDRAFT_51463 [Amanita thiersii Skay4041]|uniref:Uncharacterized protein n=1 Tax=Amanita thiersii Skay4041 TaxID=703135 RepID=A0A2A9N988_9AGAR|nr:hypothetical protein AMATHDRAFT_51463 [Amanita thiersii Skay4041]
MISDIPTWLERRVAFKEKIHQEQEIYYEEPTGFISQLNPTLGDNKFQSQCPMSRNRDIPYVLVLLVFLSLTPSIVDARGGRGGGGRGGGKTGGKGGGGHSDMDITLDLSSVPAATFSFFCIFAIIGFDLFCKGIVELAYGRKKEEDFDKRIPFIWCIFLGTASFLVEYILGAILYSQLGSSIRLSRGAPSAFTLTQEIGMEFIYTGLLFLLACRGSIETTLGMYRLLGGKISKGGPEHFIACILLLVMLASTVTRAVMSATITGNIPDAIYATYDTLRHLYVGAFCILTFMISLWSSLLWRHSKPSTLTHDLMHFDTYVLHRIVILISPALGIQALYEVIRDTIITHPAFYNNISILGLNLATLLVQGMTTSFVIFITYTLGHQRIAYKYPGVKEHK